MARLSINDLNNLSGVSNGELDNLYKCFRSAHTRLLKDVIMWCKKYKTEYDSLKDYTDERKYKIARSMYYKGTLILDNVDLFLEYTGKYVGLLTVLKKYKEVSDIRMVGKILEQSKKEIIDSLPYCYEVWNEAYNNLVEEEE